MIDRLFIEHGTILAAFSFDKSSLPSSCYPDNNIKLARITSYYGIDDKDLDILLELHVMKRADQEVDTTDEFRMESCVYHIIEQALAEIDDKCFTSFAQLFNRPMQTSFTVVSDLERWIAGKRPIHFIPYTGLI